MTSTLFKFLSFDTLMNFILSKIVQIEMIDKFLTNFLAETTTEIATKEPTSSTDTGS